MMIRLLLIGFAAFISTLLGGLFAARFRDRLHLVLGFSAGAVIGVAFFDLMPEAIILVGKSYSVHVATLVIAIGFSAYLILDRAVMLHGHSEEGSCQRGMLGASSLSIHSFLDGIAIGTAFQFSTAVGTIVAVAVLVHDFSDGINTVNLVMKNGGTKKYALKWLMVDALTPIAGILSTCLFSLHEATLGFILALFCGFFLYIGASDLLPESHHSHPKYTTTFVTMCGIVLLYIAVTFAG